LAAQNIKTLFDQKIFAPDKLGAPLKIKDESAVAIQLSIRLPSSTKKIIKNKPQSTPRTDQKTSAPF
jgi:N-acyl-L-homoserine lactone synthetase